MANTILTNLDTGESYEIQPISLEWMGENMERPIMEFFLQYSGLMPRKTKKALRKLQRGGRFGRVERQRGIALKLGSSPGRWFPPSNR